VSLRAREHESSDISSQTNTDGRERERLARTATDAYAVWRNECAAVTVAYRCWADAAQDEEATLWEAYESALEREEHISMAYVEVTDRIAQLGAGAHPTSGAPKEVLDEGA
jgi:hypothetical protein